MADDDKVKNEDLIQISKDRFLPREVRDTDPKHPEYSLEKEFAKTSKGFDWKFYSILFVFLLIVIGGTFIITTYVENQHQKTQYTFNVEDLNLQEQISSTKREEKKVNLAKSQLAAVVKDRDEKIKKIESDYSQRVEEIGKKGLSAEESRSEIAKSKNQKDAEINKIQSEFAPKVDAEEKNLAKAEKEFENKKAKLEADIHKAENIVNNYKRLQQLQIDQLNMKHATEMENQKLRYNPNFAEGELKAILKKVDRKKIQSKPILGDINGLSKNRVITESELNALRVKINDYSKLIDRMRKIPFTNSVEPAVSVIQDDTNFLITEYERILVKMIQNLELLQKYQQAFNQIAEFSVDSGIVIDGSNPEDVVYSLKPVVKIEDGDTGMIFRKADEYIGTVLFEQKFGKMQARVTDLMVNTKILPLDKIFIKKKKVAEQIIESPEDINKSGSEQGDKDNSTNNSNDKTTNEVAP